MFRVLQKGMPMLFALLFSATVALAQEVPSEYQEVLKALDRKGDCKAGVLKVNIPRNDFLISAHLAAEQTCVIDIRTNKVIATVTDMPGVEGDEDVRELQKFYTSNVPDNTIGVVDQKK